MASGQSSRSTSATFVLSCIGREVVESIKRERMAWFVSANHSVPLALAPPYAPLLNLTQLFPLGVNNSLYRLPKNWRESLLQTCLRLYIWLAVDSMKPKEFWYRSRCLCPSTAQRYRLFSGVLPRFYCLPKRRLQVMSHRNSHIEYLMTSPVLTRDIDCLVSRMLFATGSSSLVAVLGLLTMFHISFLLHVLSLLQTCFVPSSGWEALRRR